MSTNQFVPFESFATDQDSVDKSSKYQSKLIESLEQLKLEIAKYKVENDQLNSENNDLKRKMQHFAYDQIIMKDKILTQEKIMLKQKEQLLAKYPDKTSKEIQCMPATRDYNCQVNISAKLNIQNVEYVYYSQGPNQQQNCYLIKKDKNMQTTLTSVKVNLTYSSEKSSNDLVEQLRIEKLNNLQHSVQVKYQFFNGDLNVIRSQFVQFKDCEQQTDAQDQKNLKCQHIVIPIQYQSLATQKKLLDNDTHKHKSSVPSIKQQHLQHVQYQCNNQQNTIKNKQKVAQQNVKTESQDGSKLLLLINELDVDNKNDLQMLRKLEQMQSSIEQENSQTQLNMSSKQQNTIVEINCKQFDIEFNSLIQQTHTISKTMNQKLKNIGQKVNNAASLLQKVKQQQSNIRIQKLLEASKQRSSSEIRNRINRSDSRNSTNRLPTNVNIFNQDCILQSQSRESYLNSTNQKLLLKIQLLQKQLQIEKEKFISKDILMDDLKQQLDQYKNSSENLSTSQFLRKSKSPSQAHAKSKPHVLTDIQNTDCTNITNIEQKSEQIANLSSEIKRYQIHLDKNYKQNQEMRSEVNQLKTSNDKLLVFVYKYGLY